MRKCYFYAIQGEITPTGPKQTLARFRTEAERDEWVKNGCVECRCNMTTHLSRYAIPGSHPEVRRIKRMIEQGEAISFPVDVSDQPKSGQEGTTMKLTKGQTVMIYQDPVTEQRPEGKAVLVKALDSQYWKNNMEYWRVQFLSDGFIVPRFIRTAY